MANAARLAFLLALAGAVASCSKNHAVQLKDGSWQVQCEDQVERCVREAQRTCGDEAYHVISGKQEEKLYGGQNGYQMGAELHTLEFRCGSDPGVWKLERKDEAAPVEPDALRPPPAKQLCTPGTTQRCVGPAACEGGQSCNADGTGYSPCDCGTSGAAPVDAAPAPSSAPPASSAAPAPANSAAPAPAGTASPAPAPAAR